MIRTHEREGVVYLEMPEPAALGEQSSSLAQELVDTCTSIEERDGPPVAVVLKSAGRAFWLEPPRDATDCDLATPDWGHAVAALDRLGAPAIAAIHGDAIGPAWELALACDLRVVAADARIGSPEVLWGRMPAAGGTQRLMRVASEAVALRLLLLGEVLPAPAALALGLIHRVAPAQELETTVEELLDAMRGSAPIALGYAREAVRSGADLALADGLRLEADLAVLLQTTHDRFEGISSFLDKRAPRYEGR